MKQWLYFDVDETLVLWSNFPTGAVGEFEYEVGHRTYYGRPHKAHCKVLKKHKQFGKHVVVVWSKGGKTHATRILHKLGLFDYADHILAKPDAYYDDLDVKEFVKNRRYLKVED